MFYDWCDAYWIPSVRAIQQRIDTLCHTKDVMEAIHSRGMLVDAPEVSFLPYGRVKLQWMLDTETMAIRVALYINKDGVHRQDIYWFVENY